MAVSVTRYVSRSLAARKLACSRRTVQRYCRREPGLIRNGKVDLDGLIRTIAIFKFRDSRGFPLGGKRSEQKLALDVPKKPKPIIRRPLIQRFEIIRREIDAMTDDEQVRMLRFWPGLFLDFFRRHNIEKMAAEQMAAEQK